MKVLQPPGWAAPKGYANGVAASGLQVFVAGQIGWNAQCQFESDDLVQQIRLALSNVCAVLAEAGASPTHITISGDPASGAFSVFCFKEGRLLAVESLNRAPDHMAARRFLAGPCAITPEQAADPGFDVARFLEGAQEIARRADVLPQVHLQAADEIRDVALALDVFLGDLGLADVVVDVLLLREGLVVALPDDLELLRGAHRVPFLVGDDGEEVLDLGVAVHRAAAGGGGGSIFEELFGEAQRNPTGPKRGSDLRYDLELDFEEAVLGCEKEINLTKLDQCDTCHGSGGETGATKKACTTCGGQGRLRRSAGFMTQIIECPDCDGAGQKIDKPCRACRGHAGRGRPSACEGASAHRPGAEQAGRTGMSQRPASMTPTR